MDLLLPLSDTMKSHNACGAVNPCHTMEPGNEHICRQVLKHTLCITNAQIKTVYGYYDNIIVIGHEQFIYIYQRTPLPFIVLHSK